MTLTQKEMHEAGERGELFEVLEEAGNCSHNQTIVTSCGPVLDDVMCTKCNQAYTDVCQKGESSKRVRVISY